MQIGFNIKYYRELRGLTQQELADKLGEKRSMVNNWERGTEPNLANIKSLADVFDVHYTCLIDGPDTLPEEIQKIPQRPTLKDLTTAIKGLLKLAEEIESQETSLQKSDPAFQPSQEKEKGSPLGTEQRALLGKKGAGKGAKAKNS